MFMRRILCTYCFRCVIIKYEGLIQNMNAKAIDNPCFIKRQSFTL